MLAIYNEIKKFLEKKSQWSNEYTKYRVSDFLTRYYSTDRRIIETSLKTSFSRSHFSLFSRIPIEQIPAFPRKGKSPGEEVEPGAPGWANPTYSSGEKAWQRRDQPALQAKITGLLIFTSRNVGFFPFQFRIVLAALPLFKERHLAIPLSVSLKLSFSPAFWVSNPREFCHYTKIWPSAWINPPRESELVWFISFVSSET